MKFIALFMELFSFFTPSVLAVGVFVVSLILFFFEKIDKTIVSLLGATMLLVFGVLDWETAIQSIDWETIALLFGLMLVVVIAEHSGIFSWLNVKIAELSKGNPLAVFFLFSALTFFASTILNNATIVMLVVPVAIALATGLGLNSKLLVILIAAFSNIGGTLTLIGDPPNTLIGVQAKLPFMSFIENLSIPVFAMSFFILLYVALMYWGEMRPINKNLPKLYISMMIIRRIAYQFASATIKPSLIWTVCIVLLLTVVSFMIQPQLGVQIGVLGLLAGVGLSLLVSKNIPFLKVVKEIEWDSLLFFIGLFVQVGALEHTGVLKLITEWIASFSGNYALLLMVIVWGIGLASSVINNIPFVALMIPVIFDLQEKMAGTPHLDLLWWALALGACLGGNGTIIGSSSGILAVDLAKKNGIKITFWEFFKVGMPLTLISLAVASLYILWRLSL